MFFSDREPENKMKIIQSIHAYKTEYNFPDKKRSKRLYKKLIKKFGTQTYKKPCFYIMKDTIICHPLAYYELKRKLDQ